MRKKLILNKLSILGFLGYFIFLLIERILAITLSINEGGMYALVNNNAMALSFYIITCISVGLGVILFIKPVIGLCRKLCSKDLYDFDANYKPLMIASCVLLVSGMMHTGYTMSALQFVAYGLLILAMIVKTIQASEDKNIRGKSIISIIYLVFLSMAIPVCYLTALDKPVSICFYIFQFLATFSLILCFYLLTLEFFKKGFAPKSYIYPVLVLALDAAIIALKWKEEINWFVLIFATLTVIMYAVYFIYCKFKKN